MPNRARRDRTLVALVVLALVGAGLGCARAGGASQRPTHPSLEGRAASPPSAAFRAQWSDGQAELSGYRVVVSRYGAPRVGETVLVYVTEPIDRTTRIKDDDAPPDRRVEVLKLNIATRFLTGIYPYSVMTSVFSPVDRVREPGLERFAPIKLTLTVQEWCGQTSHGIFPGRDGFASELVSYFAEEGERRRIVAAPLSTIYEDALLIQLRELDGPFADGGSYRGPIVPSLWRQRRDHLAPDPVDATITRADAEREGVPVVRFTLVAGDYRRTFDVERTGARRVLGWSSDDGDSGSLLQTIRVPYWRLQRPGDEAIRRELGLDEGLALPGG